MGFRFRKSKKILPGVRLNLNKNSASVSFGPKGLKHSVSTTGRRTTTVGIPGSGLHYSESTGGRGSGGSAGAPADLPAGMRPASPKSKGFALGLCILLGYLGVHRYYVGKIGTGVLWTCTGGCFGIGWLVDIFTIAGNGFRDKENRVLRSAPLEEELAASVEPEDEPDGE